MFGNASDLKILLNWSIALTDRKNKYLKLLSSKRLELGKLQKSNAIVFLGLSLQKLYLQNNQVIGC